MLANDNKDCLNVWFFYIFFKPETELVVAWLRWSLHPLLVYMVYRPRDLYKSDSSPCGPVIEYASTVRDPTTQTSINSLELIQRRAARFVTKMLDDLGWDSLQSRRKDNRLAMLCRIQNDLVDINRTQYLTGGDSRTRRAHKFYQQRITHDVYNNSFFPRTIRDWNTACHSSRCGVTRGLPPKTAGYILV